MKRVAALAAVLGTTALAVPAVAQPVDPYGDPPAPAPKPDDPRDPYSAPATPPPTSDTPPPTGDTEVDDAVAAWLLGRARTLSAEGNHADAKQLVVESLVRSPNGPSAAEARALLTELNGKLGIRETAPPAPITLAPPDRFTPTDLVEEPHDQPLADLPPRPSRAVRYGSGIVAGAVAGGLLADVADLDGTTGGDVVAGALLGALGGGLAAHALDTPSLSRGDHALIGSMTAWGLAGGLTLGLAIDPPTGEAYSLNGVFGLAGGYLIGHIAARRTDVTPRRMLRVNGLALAGAAAPWILYGLTRDGSTRADEQAFGLLSTAGLVAGAYLGFRLTRDMKDDEAAPKASKGPAALFRRHAATGRWDFGGLGFRNAMGATGGTVNVLGGAW